MEEVTTTEGSLISLSKETTTLSDSFENVNNHGIVLINDTMSKIYENVTGISSSTEDDPFSSTADGVADDVTVADTQSAEQQGPGIGSTVIASVFLLMTAMTIIGNFLVIISPFVDNKLRNNFTYYIINLGVTDFLVALTAMSFYSFDVMLGYWPFGEVMCAIWIFFDYGMTFASVFTLVVISIDRWVSLF